MTPQPRLLRRDTVSPSTGQTSRLAFAGLRRDCTSLQASTRAPSPRAPRTAAWAFRAFDVISLLLLFDIILQRGSEFEAQPEGTLPWSPASRGPIPPAVPSGSGRCRSADEPSAGEWRAARGHALSPRRWRWLLVFDLRLCLPFSLLGRGSLEGVASGVGCRIQAYE